MSAPDCLEWPICPTCERPREMQEVVSMSGVLRCQECRDCWAGAVCESYHEIKRLELDCDFANDGVLQTAIETLLQGAKVQ